MAWVRVLTFSGNLTYSQKIKVLQNSSPTPTSVTDIEPSRSKCCDSQVHIPLSAAAFIATQHNADTVSIIKCTISLLHHAHRRRRVKRCLRNSQRVVQRNYSNRNIARIANGDWLLVYTVCLLISHENDNL